MPHNEREVVEFIVRTDTGSQGVTAMDVQESLAEAFSYPLERVHVVALQQPPSEVHGAGIEQALAQALRETIAQLAECYRLSGADPDGDSDSMLAQFAVEEVGRMRKELDEAEQTTLSTSDRERLQEAEERVKELEAALTPFAWLADEADRFRHSDDSTCEWRLTAGDLRKARAALAGASDTKEDA